MTDHEATAPSPEPAPSTAQQVTPPQPALAERGVSSEAVADEATRAIEAVLLVATDPTPVHLLAQLLELGADEVDARCRALAAHYEDHDRGFQLVEVAGGWRYQTHPDLHPYVERYALEGVPNRLSSAALETLAIVAYKQPISRGQLSAIRGVNVDAVLRTLVQRGYVAEQGRDDGPGQAALFGTTPQFLERLGFASLDDLPALGDFVPSAAVVEALEQTLRIDEQHPIDPNPPGDLDLRQPEEPNGDEPTDAAGAPNGAASSGDGEAVIDLREADGRMTAGNGHQPQPNGDRHRGQHGRAPGPAPDG